MNAKLTATAEPRLLKFDFLWNDSETGLRWLYTSAADFAEFKALPAVVSFEGRHFVKSGWNSDSGSVSYRQRTARDIVAEAC